MLQSGQMLSHYRLVEKIGEGGMGLVWKALDTRLNRHVAIKILPPELTSDPERRLRFQFVASPIWLRYFRFGPLEWLWRSLTCVNKQPMKQRA